MKTGNTRHSIRRSLHQVSASMEPGHEDREYLRDLTQSLARLHKPQWSPVMKTGNTAPFSVTCVPSG